MIPTFSFVAFATLATAIATTSNAQPPGATAPLAVSGGQRTLLYVGPITHQGAIPANVPTLRDGGSAPFLVMFSRVLPNGWTVWQGNITEPLPGGVSWTAGKRWFETLGEILLPNNLRAEIDWKTQQIVLHTQRLQGSTQTAPLLVNIPPPPSLQRPSAAPQGSALAPPPPPPVTKPEIPVWTVLPSDATLRNAMQRWSKEAGWSLIYEASNYAFDSFGEFEGDFKPVVCKVLANINASLAENKKAAPLNAGFWVGNRTIRIFDVRPDTVINAPDTCEPINTQRPRTTSAPAPAAQPSTQQIQG